MYGTFVLSLSLGTSLLFYYYFDLMISTIFNLYIFFRYRYLTYVALLASNRRRSTGYRAHCRAYRNLATVQKGRKKHKIQARSHTHMHNHRHITCTQTHKNRPPNIRANRINYDRASSSLARYFGNNRRTHHDTTDPKS
ncbi:unnamed protein product [Aphis gossypii]|uniref:Uncharacterized protein n=1 Tax=Aphis gossypii TaxID=80765 RepID=A0A9P0NRJ4_APHGO|nr:unnamed protein product [Aphis gossypii]